MSKQCPKCKTPMLMMFGCGWDYDRWMCPERGCDGEIELTDTTYPPDYDDSVEIVVSWYNDRHEKNKKL